MVAPNTGIYLHFDSDAGFHAHYMASAATGLAGLRKRASPEGGLALVPGTSAVSKATARNLFGALLS